MRSRFDQRRPPAMAEKASWMDADIELSVNVRSALEWRPEDWEYSAS